MVLWLLAQPRCGARRCRRSARWRRRPRAAAADLGAGRPRHAVDRPLAALRTAAGDPPVLPDRAPRARRSATASSCWSRCRSSPASALGLWRMFDRPPPARTGAAGKSGGAAEARRQERGALIAARSRRAALLIPLVLVAFGADYLAPRNLVGAMIPLTALIAVLAHARRGTGRAALARPDRARPSWRSRSTSTSARACSAATGASVAQVLRGGLGSRARSRPSSSARRRWSTTCRACTTSRAASTVLLGEIDETGYAPLRVARGDAPAPGFRLLGRRDVDGLIVYRFALAGAPRRQRGGAAPPRDHARPSRGAGRSGGCTLALIVRTLQGRERARRSKDLAFRPWRS